MRHIYILATFVVLCGPSAIAEPQTLPLPAWIAEQATAVKTKRAAIKEAAAYHNTICAKQATDDKIKDCNVLLDAILARRDHEEDLLLDMIVAATLPDKIRDAKLPAMLSSFRETDAFTSEMAKKFSSVYPKQ